MWHIQLSTDPCISSVHEGTKSYHKVPGPRPGYRCFPCHTQSISANAGMTLKCKICTAILAHGFNTIRTYRRK
jgi:hypothetical protein